MTDAEYRTQKARVLKAYNKWHSPTGMGAYVVSHSWHRDGTAGQDQGGCDGWTVSARCSVKWEYLDVCFHWNLQHFQDVPDHTLDRIVRHEICHALVNEMRCWAPPKLDDDKMYEAMQHEEHVVSQLQSVLLSCFDAGARSVKRRSKK